MEKELIGGRGRKKQTSDYYKKIISSKLLKLNFKGCMTLTVKQLKNTYAYKNLYYDPKSRVRAPIGAKYGNKSYLRKADLCKYLADPNLYKRDMDKI